MVSAYCVTMDVLPFWADTSFWERLLAKQTRITLMNGFSKTQIQCLCLQPTCFYWTSSPTLSLPPSSSQLMITFTPLKRTFLLYALAKRRAFACEHRRHANWKQEKKYLQSVRCLSLHLLPSNQRFLLLKKLLIMSISCQLIHL